jgi:TRAP-type transport system small permease protein
MWAKKVADSLEKALKPIIPVTGMIGSAVIAVVMFLTVADVVGRKFFNKPITGTYEISEMFLVIVVFSTAAYCQLLRGHVTIDLLVERFNQKTRDIIDAVMYVVFLVIFVFLSWQLYVYAIEILNQKTVSGTILLPIYPFAFIAAIGATLLCLVVFMHLMRYISKATGNEVVENKIAGKRVIEI